MHSRALAGRRASLLCAVAGLTVALSTGLLSPATAKGAAKSYNAPFRQGPSGGDSFSYHQADANGMVTVGRAYPVPGAINCTKGGPYAKLIVRHHATSSVRKVVVTYTSAAIDNFTFATVGLRERSGRWYGTTSLRGFVAGSGTITLVPDHQTGKFPRTLVVEFGLQQSSACPNADAGTMHFTSVRVVQ
jgi:hypothetical protein